MDDYMDLTPTAGEGFQFAAETHIRRDVVPDESLTIGNILSRELLKLSMTDRSAIEEEIHGVRCLAIRESPELIRSGLSAFQTELQKLPSELKRTYDECCVRAMLYKDEEDTCYALKDSFKLSFLRAELFDAAKAVQRFVKYLEFVRDFWGPEIALKRQVRISDFDKIEMKLFRKGYFQVLPFRDLQGRRAISLLGGFEPGVDPKARAKAIFYLADSLTRDNIETQRAGTIFLTEAYMWSTGDSSFTTAARDKRSTSLLSFPHPQEGLYYTRRVMEAMPNRLVAVHNCWPDRPAFRLISKLLTIYGASGSTQRLRLKFHIGDELEMRYRLKSYGIPIELLPITETGSIKLVNHNHWMKTRKHLEQALDESERVVECPGLNDVVFRQGTSSMEHPGNVRCRDLILSLLEDRDRQIKAHPEIDFDCYNTTSGNNNTAAAKIHNEIVDRFLDKVIRQRGGCFLEWNKHRSAWVQFFNETKIKQKISVLFHSIDKRYRRVTSSNTSYTRIPTIRADEVRSDPVVGNSNMIGANTDDGNADAMDTKSEDDTMMEELGPYAFLEGGSSTFNRQRQCCQTNDDDMSRKRQKKF